MMGEYEIAPLENLIEQFHSFPGIGLKTASRLAYHVLSMSEEQAETFAGTIVNSRKMLHHCKICGNLTDKDICSICSDESRDKSIICVVEDFKDVFAFEKTKEFHALYHVLNGCLSPMKGITPDMLSIKELLARLGDGTVKEVIMATNATVEGETTAMYLAKLIKPFNIKITRLAYGLPIGANVEYADEVTLARSISGRNIYN